MKEELIKFETSILAKEKDCNLELFGEGFEYINNDGDECWTNVEGGISGEEDTKPVIKCTQGLLQRWLREIHNIHVEVWFDRTQTDGFPYLYEIYDQNNEMLPDDKLGNYFDNYEECMEFGLYEALKLIKND